MSFANLQVSVDTLPSFGDVDFQPLHESYARLVLGIALVVLTPVLIFVTVLVAVVLVPIAGLPLLAAIPGYLAVVALLSFLAWFSFKSARVMRYAVREHDLIVHSGVFWQKQTVQPIRRIQHVEQNQGPIDKRFGLYELKLFSAGTGHFTFRIPGLDADSASRIRRFILDVQQDGWSDSAESKQADSLLKAADAGGATVTAGTADSETSLGERPDD